MRAGRTFRYGANEGSIVLSHAGGVGVSSPSRKRLSHRLNDGLRVQEAALASVTAVHPKM